MDPRARRLVAGNLRQVQHLVEGIADRARGNPPVPRREEDLIVQDGLPAPEGQVPLEGRHHRGMQGDQAALPELRPPEVPQERGADRLREGQPVRASTLAAHGQPARAPIEVAELEPSHLASAQSKAGQQ